MASTSDSALFAPGFPEAFRRFKSVVQNRSGHPFASFGTGLPFEWEGYKEWVYHTGRSTLGFESWRKSKIGSGSILRATLEAIQLHHDKVLRNNLVEWDGRYGERSRSHATLLAAAKDRTATRAAERTLFDLYAGEADEATCFAELISVAGKRYDLIAYLFFLKDWTKFMPARSSSFPRAFAELGLPLAMQGQCSWENYREYLVRLETVRLELEREGIPGVRLLDAHSFCWMLAGFKDESAQPSTPSAPRFLVSEVRAAPASPDRFKATGAEKTPAPIDYAEREESQRRIGFAAQRVVLKAEKTRLSKLARKDLADRVQDVSANASLGYDIHSFHEDGSDKFIEVKAASTSSSRWNFFLSENELIKSRRLPGYVFALVGGCESTRPTIWEFKGSDLPAAALRPVTFHVSLQAP